MTTIDRDGPVFVAGRGGLAGSAISTTLESEGVESIVGGRSSDLDLRDRRAVDDFFDEVRPTAVVLAAARVGGIAANAAFPVEYLSDNLRIQLNVLDAARRTEVDRLVFIASAAAYPSDAASPMTESALLSGPPDPAHAGYALAKLAGIQYVRLLRAEGRRWTALVPTNIYGPGDNFHAEWSHVVPALLRRFHEAKIGGAAEVSIWGSGRVRREFLHSADLATACRTVLALDDAPAVLNVGPGSDVTIAELVEHIRKVVGFQGEVVFDASRPDGVARRLLDSSALRSLGWEPDVDLRAGLDQTYRWLEQRWPDVRT